MRIFLALRPPAAAVAELRQATQPMRRALLGLRWTHAQDHHITLHFLGEIGPWGASLLHEPMQRLVARTPAPALRLSGVGHFPQDSTHARVVWAGIGGDLDGLHRLHAELASALLQVGLTPEQRPYHPHLTVARAPRRPLEIGGHLSRLHGFHGALWRAVRVELLGGTPGAVPRYSRLAAWRLHWQ